MSHQMVLLLQLLSLASLADPPHLYSNCNIQNRFLPHIIFITLCTFPCKSITKWTKYNVKINIQLFKNMPCLSRQGHKIQETKPGCTRQAFTYAYNFQEANTEGSGSKHNHQFQFSYRKVIHCYVTELIHIQIHANQIHNKFFT